MRRTILSAQPARAVTRVFGNAQPRRTFAIASSNKEQVFPVGAFYEAVVRTPSGAIPKVKPEEPPVTSQESSKPAPKTTTPEKPASEERPKPTAQDVPKVEDKPATPAEKPKEKPTEDKPSKPVSPPKNTTSAESKSAAAAEEEPKEKSASRKTRKPRTNGNGNGNGTKEKSRARVIFGSSLAGPAERAERLARIKNQSRLIAGVLVPPKPEEPDNCCMSGCVNCVWDRYRDEMEDWASKSREAEARLAAREASSASGSEGGVVSATEESMEATTGKQKIHLGVRGLDGARVGAAAVSMDDDGGGSASNWSEGKTTISKNLWDDELYKNVPVGIREFMKQEKRLKEKHSREGTLGG
ncbi:oxidoreductase-like protein [Cladorrhinum sp. PSN259]|nr:oxidoreductase-like protein [Cladorrhinum sp. PSN259]